MANPQSLWRPPAGERIDPTAIDATGTTLGDSLTSVSDGTGGKRAGYATSAATYTDEQAQDAVGAALTSTATVTLTYNDGANTISAAINPSSLGPSATAAWMPLTTVVGGVPELVWDAANSLIPTYTPL